MNPDVLVSVIIPVYNAEAVLERSIGSVLAQEFENWELVAVDDASQDRSFEILQEFAARDPRIHVWAMEENSGAGAARNLAMHHARGRYFAFLDADDEWLPQKLQRQIEFMQSRQIAFSCTAYERVRRGRVIHVPEKADYDDLADNNTVATLTAVYDASLLGKHKMPLIRRRQDYALWLTLLEHVDYVYGLDEVLARYHSGQRSLSSNKFLAARDQWRFFRGTLGLDFGRSVRLFGSYARNALRRNL